MLIGLVERFELAWMTGSGTEGMRSSNGSMMMAKPRSYVPTSVAKFASMLSGVNSSVSVISSVFVSDVSRS